VKIVDGFSGPKASDAAAGAGRLQRGISKLHEYELRYTPWTYEAQHRLRYLGPTIRAERAVNTHLFKDQVLEHVAEFQPDVIVSTHERVTSPLGAMRRSGELQVPTVAALFDSAPHGMWLAPGIDQHIVYNRNDLGRIGAVFAGGPDDALRAVVARPPVDPRALATYDRAAVRESFGLPVDRPIALVSGGSAGYALRDDDVWRLIHDTDFHIAVAAGRNEGLIDHIAKTFPSDRVTAVPYTKEMPSLVSASDVALLNANGATSAEAFAAGTPVVVFNAMAGHGRTSARAIDTDRLATYAEDPNELVDALRRVEAGDADITDRVANARALYRRDRSYGDVIVGARLAT
jgi:UDP-N-acetylglucosamine:LPS N-acetylglucosamine transferase